MHNLMLRLAVITAALTYLGTTTAIAQSLFDFSPKKNTSTQTNDAKKTVTVLSPSDFRNAVNKKAQETSNSITQQVQSQFITQTPSQPSPPPPPSQAPSRTPTSSTVPANTMPPTTAPTTPYQSTGSIANSPVLAPPPAPTPPPAAPTTPVQNQPYTGFGTGNTNKNAAPASGNSGGWNIKY